MDEKTDQTLNGANIQQLKLDILSAQNDFEVLNALKKHGFYESSKCPICVRFMEARFATIQ